MQVTFLGTGTSGGVPLIGCQCEVCKSTDPRDNRLRTSVFIQHENLNLVIDCGPDFRQQMLRENIAKLDAILMTHAHKDHTAGFDDIRAFNFMQQKPMDVYCTEETEAGIKEQFSYAFTETDYPYLPKMNFKRIDNKQFAIGNLKIQPIEVMHGSMKVNGYRFGHFTYITDAKTISKTERDKIRGSKILVVNALRPEQHYSHFTIDEALELVADVKPGLTYFTHMSHQFGLHKETEKKLPNRVLVAYDGLKIEI